MVLHVTDHGDPNVGIFAQSWSLDCPFNKEEIDKENLEFFRNGITNLYKEFAEGRITAEYDFEEEEKLREEQAFDFEHEREEPETKYYRGHTAWLERHSFDDDDRQEDD